MAIKNCELPDESWEKFPVSVFPGGIYYDYATARAKARKAEETSDLQSDVEAMKRKIIRKRCSSSEESGPDHTPRMCPLPRMKKVIEDSTSLLPPPPKMRKSFIRSEKFFNKNNFGFETKQYFVVLAMETRRGVFHRVTTLKLVSQYMCIKIILFYVKIVGKLQ